ncbi:IS110 family transposase, partial [Antarctobacter heliothermus]
CRSQDQPHRRTRAVELAATLNVNGGHAGRIRCKVRPHVFFQRREHDGSACILIAWRHLPPICDVGRHDKRKSTIHFGIDISKDKLAVAIAGGGVRDEVLSWGSFENTPASVDRLLRKLSGRGSPVSVCYEAGPTGYGLYRQVRAFGFECCVVAPSLIPVRAGERVKTDRLDAIRLARVLRAGELTPIWVPDETHEAMRDLVRARESAAEDQRHKRQLVSAFMLRHGRIYHRPKPWRMRLAAKPELRASGASNRPSGNAAG